MAFAESEQKCTDIGSIKHSAWSFEATYFREEDIGIMKEHKNCHLKIDVGHTIITASK